MAYTNLAPRTKSITGTDLTGSDGTANRTYTIPDVGVLSSGVDIVINGTQLHGGSGLDYTMTGEDITFLNIVDNSDVIRINYFIALSQGTTSSLVTSTALKYATPLQFAAILGWNVNVPSWDIGSEPTNEAVGTGNDSNTIFYLDHQNIISDSYVLYADGVEMTETTHFTLDKTKGKITLTATGVTFLSTNDLTAEYSYYSNSMNDDFVVSTLVRAEAEVNNSVNTTFTDTSAENPDIPLADEKYATKGYFEQQYFTKQKNPVDLDDSLTGDIAIDAVTIGCSSSTKFPSTGYILVGSEVISYTGITGDDFTGCTRGALGSTAATHSEGDEIHTSIMQVSGASQGTEPIFSTLRYGEDFYVDNRKFFIYKSAIEGVGLASNQLHSIPDVENRVRLVYLYGNIIIPTPITRLTLLYAKRMLITDNVGKSMIAGRNEFRPEMLNADMEEIDRIVSSYIEIPMGNT